MPATMKKIKKTYILLKKPLFSLAMVLSAALGSSNVVFVAMPKYYCGNWKAYHFTTNIDFGCSHHGNPIMDITFAILRVLSDGVGIVVVGSVIYGGILYVMSKGDPQATAKAIGRIRSSLTALLIFIFAYAILNYLIPQGFFQ